METANFVTYPDMLQLLAIFSGIWFAIFSLAVSAGVAWYIRDSNRRDRDNERRDKDHERRHQEIKDENERRHQEIKDENERRHQELLRAVSLLYRHTHDDAGRVIIPAEEIVPAADDD